MRGKAGTFWTASSSLFWAPAAVLLLVCAAVALGYEWLGQSHAKQQLQAFEERQKVHTAVVLQSKSTTEQSTGDGRVDSGNGPLAGGVNAIIGSLLTKGDTCEDHAALYPSIYNDLIPWMSRGITQDDIAACTKNRAIFVDFAIVDNVIYVTSPPMPDWVNGLYFLSLADIQEVLIRDGVRDMVFRVQFSDWPQIPIDRDPQKRPLGTEPACPSFSWVKDSEHLDILIPDGDFHKHSFDEWVANRSAADAVPWAAKLETAVGRFTNFPTGKRAASRRGETVIPRNFYSQLSNETLNSHLDVGLVEQRGWLPLEEQLSHKYALSVGRQHCFNTLQMLLASGQVALKHVSHYWMYYEAALHPWEEYIPVGSYDAKDIIHIIDWLRQHDDMAQRVAQAGQRFAARHLTRPGRLCYLRKLLHEYGTLFRYKPALSDFGNYTRLQDEVQRYNDTERFHTVRGYNYMSFFHWTKEEAVAADAGPGHAGIPVT